LELEMKMKKKKSLILSGLSMMLANILFVSIPLMAGLMFTACRMDGGDTGGGSNDTAVNVFFLDGKVTAPVKGATPDTGSIDTAQYIGAVGVRPAWGVTRR
jgi:hypothetical protein